ncbi:hypothetical protein HQ403_02705 [Candidatus Kaiserbacteria bacterium]|nr:hypothetical protein [Candidatus Kaiserbacteria bacterium]
MKRSIDDIILPEDRDRRSIRKVSVDRSPRRKRPELVQEVEQDLPPRPPRSRRASSRLGLWIISIVSLLVLVFGFSFLFSGAKLVVTPKQRTVLVDAEFKAFKNPKVNELGYEIITIEREGTQDVTASGEEFVKEKSSGTIVVYNNYSTANQRLIKNTRFETPEGLIYRINESITVPGKQKENGVTVPGSIEVTVYADEVGEAYNIGLTDFTIPGFEGDPRYDDFYARSKTNMFGGFEGQKKVVSEADETKARDEIKEKLKTQLLKDVFSQKPEGFEIYEDGVFITFASLPDGENGDRVAVKEKAVLYGVLFERTKFAQFVAQNTIAGFEGGEVEILDPNTLTFSVLGKDQTEPWINEEFLFKLGGNAHIVWDFESDQLKNDLSGKSKDALQTVLTGYPSIDEAQIVLRPFWRQTFPDNIKDIKITTIIEK